MVSKYSKYALPAALAICVIIVIVFVAGGGNSTPEQHQMPPAEVSVVSIKTQSVTFTKDLPGRTSAFRAAEIRPQVNGIITKRLFEEGSDVKEGQQLYQIDPATYQAAYNSALADLQKAEANAKSSKAKAERYDELVKIGGVSKQENDDAQAGLAQGEADIAIAKAALSRARIDLNYTKVLSPISGRIGQSLVTEGALVTANQANPIAIVQQFDKIYVDVTQSSTELLKLREQYEAQAKEGKAAPTAKLVIDGKVYEEEGVLQFSDARVNESTGTIQIRALFPNPEGRILPGLFVHARLTQYTEENAILVPQKSTTRNPDGSVTVWVIDAESKVSVRPIKVSEVVKDQWLVTSGLKAGDKVVVEGIMKLAPGAQVKAVEESQQAQKPQAN